MLSSLRPAALKILEEVAAAYHGWFNRPLPVSSLVRPELYQRALRRVNRNAVLIDTPPHSTGLAFDIDYRYMSGGEQTFVMAELARLKLAGRIEAIRERSANYHVFAFLHGTRPSDELITDSLDEATLDKQEANHSATQPPQVSGKKQQASKPKQTLEGGGDKPFDSDCRLPIANCRLPIRSRSKSLFLTASFQPTLDIGPLNIGYLAVVEP